MFTTMSRRPKVAATSLTVAWQSSGSARSARSVCARRPAAAHRGRGPLRRLGGSAVDERDVDATLRERRRDGLAHAGATGDERRPSFQLHGTLPRPGRSLHRIRSRYPRTGHADAAGLTSTRVRLRHGAGADAGHRRAGAGRRRRRAPRSRGHRPRDHLRAAGDARRAAHLPRRLRAHCPASGVRRISLVSEYRRVVLLVEEKMRLLDRNYGVRQMTQALTPWRGLLEVIVELQFHPQNNYVGVPLIDVLLVPLDGAGHADAGRAGGHRPPSALRPVLGSAADGRPLVAVSAALRAGHHRQRTADRRLGARPLRRPAARTRPLRGGGEGRRHHARQGRVRLRRSSSVAARTRDAAGPPTRSRAAL